MKKIFFITFLVYTSMVNVYSQNDSLALVALYNATDGPNWTNKTNWLTSNPISTWFGVNVGNYRVTQLLLDQNNLNGQIPVQVGNLTALYTLALSGNNLSGPIPREIGNLTELTELHLSRSNLNGTIPSELCNLNKLTKLMLYSNNLTGQIPEGIGNLTNLIELNLGQNQLDGSIPPSLGNLTRLKELIINANKHTGSIPVEIGNLNELLILGLPGNLLEGDVPSSINNLVKLRQFEVHMNKLSGMPDISSLQNLYMVNLQNNYFAFEDIVPNKSIQLKQQPWGPAGEFIYLPQKTIVDQVEAFTINVGQSVELTANYSYNGCTYSWYRDNNVIDGATGIKYITSSPGQFFYKVTNSLAPDLILSSHIKTVIESQINPSEQDSLALVALYNATDGPSWTNKTNWLTSNPVSTWFGVTVENGRVAQLNLGQNNLVGQLPGDIGNLTALTELNLRENDFGGPLPSEIGNLSELRFLDMVRSNLNGIIPPEICNLTNLEFLYLTDNYQITGPIPDNIGNLVNLKHLYLDSNEIEGEIPESIGNLFQLIILNLAANQLSGEIPSCIGSLQNLIHIELEENQFEGELPTSFTNLTNLAVLIIYENNLTGFPDFSSFPDLVLGLSYNYLTFKDIIPNVQLCNNEYFPQKTIVDQVEQFTINVGQSIELTANYSYNGCTYSWYRDNNVIDGATGIKYITSLPGQFFYKVTNSLTPDLILSSHIKTVIESQINPSEQDSLALVALYNATDGPNWISNTNWLIGPVNTWHGITVENNRVTRIDLNDNNLTGYIPVELGKISDLQYLHLQNNHLAGPIPSELGQLSNLIELFLRGNQLTGSIPAELGQLSNLQDLLLYSNQLTGSIPPELGRLTKLQGLSVVFNQLTGSIPPELGQLSELRVLELSWNPLTGSIPPVLGQLINLGVLSLSHNQFSGTIPVEIGQLTKLKEIYLCDNQLTGSIPPELGQLSDLTIMELDKNQLTGIIPVDLGLLTNLARLRLGYNQLTGSIPKEFGYLTNLSELGLYENQLTGSIPAEFGQMTSLQALNLTANKLTGTIPPELDQLNSLQVLALGFNQLTGSIPPELGNLANLQWVFFNNNNLSGTIPVEICNLPLIQRINFSENNFDNQSCPAIQCLRYKNVQFEDPYQLQQSGFSLLAGCITESDNAVLTSNAYAITFTNDSAAITGFDYKIFLSDLVDSLIVPIGAKLVIFDKNHTLIPFEILNNQGENKSVTVNSDTYIEVTAQNNITKIVYRLNPFYPRDTIIITSDYYYINQEDSIISSVDPSTTVEELLSKLFTIPGAIIKIVDINGIERITGLLNIGDKLVVIYNENSFYGLKSASESIIKQYKIFICSTPPVVKTHSIIIKLNEGGLATISPSDIDNGSLNSCGESWLTISKSEFNCNDVGENIVILAINNYLGKIATSKAIITVESEKPVISDLIVPIGPIPITNDISLYASYKGIDLESATWDWGDGKTSQGIFNNNIQGIHIYSLPGVYVVTLIITDICGNSSTFEHRYIVVYDPEGGFVTGGGWINSPVGASTIFPEATGKTNFGFVSKYKKGTSVPTGNTEFKFKAGNIDFKSNNYDWLVVAGSKAMFKGWGTINGVGNYGFIISAIDGDLKSKIETDKFRIEIWASTNEETIYDNQMGAGINDDPTTSIAGGSIVINHPNQKSAELFSGSDYIPVNFLDNLNIYPNPVSGILRISGIEATKKSKIVLLDIMGKVVFIEEINSKDTEIDVTNLANGIYILSIRSGANIINFRILKK